MLAREYLREQADEYRAALKNRGSKVDLDRFIDLDVERRRTIAQVETLKNQRNVASQEIATLKKNKQDASAQIDAMKLVGDEIKQLDARLAEIEELLRAIELDLPNQRFQAVELSFRSEIAHKADFNIFAINIAIEIEQVNFQHALGFSAADRGPITEIDDPVMQDSVDPRFR